MSHAKCENTKEEAPAAGQQNEGSNLNDHQQSSTAVVAYQSQAAPATSINTGQPASLARSERPYPEVLEPWQHPVHMESIADEMAQRFRQHCILTEEETDAIVLWIISSYLINSFRIFPKLSLISPEKRCGKSTLMEVIHAFSHEGLLVSNISGATIYRITKQVQPTLLIDEADTFVKNGDPQLTGIINSSHSRQGSSVMRCEGDNLKPNRYSTWMPIILASIGALPPTIMDRSIVINLRRKKASESVARIPADLFDQCQPCRQKVIRWCLDHQSPVESHLVEPPARGNDRAVDNWLPLFSVAQQIGGSWTARCLTAYEAMTSIPEPELPTQLLRDIKQLFVHRNEPRITSEELIQELCQDSSSPWMTSHNGKKLNPNKMAGMLQPYGIKPKAFRFQNGIKRGYEQQQFEDAFERYLS